MESTFKERGATEYLLDGMYKNVKMASENIVCLMPKVKDRFMTTDMTRFLEEYSEFSKNIENMMHERGFEPKEPGFLSKMGAAAGVSFNTVIESSPSRIARVYIGKTQSSIKRLERLRDEAGGVCDSAALSVCRSIIEKERLNTQKMEAYL